MQEIIVNVHMHSTYSDGNATHAEIALAALRAGIDAVIVTDHNVLVKGIDGYTRQNGRCILLMTGEEVHDQTRNPQKSHLLVLGADREVVEYAPNVAQLVEQVHRAGGLALPAHPFEDALPLFNEDDISWEDWQVEDIDGLEIWNFMSELKSRIHNRLDAMLYSFFPQLFPLGPNPEALKKWDEILINGRQVTAIAGSDAHALKARMGPIRRTLFPYDFHFRTVNNHLLTPEKLSGNLKDDRRMILDTLKQSRLFIGYDLAAPTSGFRFTAKGRQRIAEMGDQLKLDGGVTFQITLPQEAECRLLHNGQVIKKWQDQTICTHIATQPGAYRVECYLDFWGRRRGWIFSNSILVNDRE